MIVTFTIDDEYVDYGCTLLQSLQQHNPKWPVYAKLINVTDHNIDKLKRLHNMLHIFPYYVPLDTKRNKTPQKLTSVSGFSISEFLASRKQNKKSSFLYSDKMAFCTNSRYDIVLLALQDTDEDVLLLDADLKVVRPIDRIQHTLQHCGVSIVGDMYLDGERQFEGAVINSDLIHRNYNVRKQLKFIEGKQFDDPYYMKDRAHFGTGVVAFRNDQKTYSFVEQFYDEIKLDIYKWGIEEQVLFKMLVDGKVELFNLSHRYKDEQLGSNSYIWSGAGTTKFTHEQFTQ